ncbi:TadE/TadG family type IV pilus assembly protein [Maritalea mediterranea]|uniref:Pilus assembly protein n=1 Tax=Maritalea mediterranea TaxID=2909667 RepID=A0ABS9E3U8_9HYPH|nr:TadE/TadG family type IV pilus assembly protein [Maritalea mediterranea]MCF4097468.1 pilus assembly protein [Maritalea mediterranea]
MKEFGKLKRLCFDIKSKGQVMSFARKCRRAYKQLRHRRFHENESGVTVVEFALLALPFFAVIGAILETGVVLLASQVLDSAVHDATRVVRTGEAQSKGYEIPEFRAKICDKTFGLFDCNQLRIRVQVIESFSSAQTNSPVDEDGDWVWASRFEPGDRNEVVLVETHYKWPTILNIMGFRLGSLNGNSAMLMSSSRVFMNEPF